MRPCNVANVIKVEAQNRSKPGKTDGVLRSLQTCLEQPVIIDAAFPVLGLSSPCCACMRLILLHSLFSRQFAEHGRPACRLISSKQGAQRLLEDRLKFKKPFPAQPPVDNPMVARERHRHLRGDGDASVCCLDGAAHACAHRDRKSTRLNSSHSCASRMPSS